MIWHSGMTEGSAAIVMFLPDQDVSVVLMINRSHGAVDALAAQMLRILCGKEPKPAPAFNMFRAISLVFTAMAFISAALLVWLGLRIRADLAGRAATGSWPVWRALLLTAGAGRALVPGRQAPANRRGGPHLEVVALVARHAPGPPGAAGRPEPLGHLLPGRTGPVAQDRGWAATSHLTWSRLPSATRGIRTMWYGWVSAWVTNAPSGGRPSTAVTFRVLPC